VGFRRSSGRSRTAETYKQGGRKGGTEEGKGGREGREGRKEEGREGGRKLYR